MHTAYDDFMVKRAERICALLRVYAQGRCILILYAISELKPNQIQLVISLEL